MKKALLLLLVILLLPVWAACAGEAAESPEKDLSRFAGIKVGVITGSQNGPQAEAAIPDVKIYYYNTLADALVAMRSGKVDAVCNDESLYKFLLFPPTERTEKYISQNKEDPRWNFAEANRRSSKRCRQTCRMPGTGFRHLKKRLKKPSTRWKSSRTSFLPS